mgnify:CR=1 FL=1
MYFQCIPALYVDTSAPPQSPANEAGRGKKLNPFDNVADVLRLPGAIVKIKVIGNLTGPKNVGALFLWCDPHQLLPLHFL